MAMSERFDWKKLNSSIFGYGQNLSPATFGHRTVCKPASARSRRRQNIYT
jgi:hypothetical protein